MEVVLLSFFLHEDNLYLYFNNNTEIKIPAEQEDYDPFVMSWWGRNLTPLMCHITKEHITLTETLQDGTKYKLTF